MLKLVSRIAQIVSLAAVVAALAGNTPAQEPSQKTAAPKAPTSETKRSSAPAAFIGTPDKIKWSQLAPGVELGPVYGECDKPGAPCVFQLRFAAGGKIPPHWHPVDEHVTVLSGDFRAGMGDTLDESKMVALPAGSYVLMPRRMHHYAMAKSAALVQVHGVGPFKINYVNPSDDPSKAAARSAD
jgi:anti-sigma factor ChrR (cupin superfamily)